MDPILSIILMSIGSICAGIETLIPPVITSQNLFANRSGILILAGVTVSIVGIAIIGYAGSLKSKNMSEKDKKATVKEFALNKGLFLSIRFCSI